MKIQYNTKENTIELETQTLFSFCQTCGGFIGSIDIIKGSESLHYILANHICRDCFDKLGLKRVNPKITFK